MAKVTREELLHIADQARLHLTEDELTHYEDALNETLQLTEKLQEIDTADVTPTTNAIQHAKVLREDRPIKWDKREAALANAPEQDEGHFKVPAIMD